MKKAKLSRSDPPDWWTKRPDRPKPPRERIEAAQRDVPEVLAGGERIGDQWEEEVGLLAHYLLAKGHSGLAIEWALFVLFGRGELVLSDSSSVGNSVVRSTARLWEEWSGDSDVAPDCSPDSRPPSAPSWEFQPGRFCFRGVEGELGGKEMDVLEALAHARRRLTLDDLRQQIWGEPGPEDATIRSVISRLRNELRQAFGLNRSEDPIPCFDGGYRLELPEGT